MYFLGFLAVLAVFKLAIAALTPCDSTVTCPTGGIWSEWTTTQTCPTTCGSCSTLYHTRKCLSASAINCPCIGNYSRYIPCNTNLCAYPAQRTCCIPYSSTVVNGSFVCGPPPKYKEAYTSCCPVGGLWSPWSGYSRNDEGGYWIRTRRCLSEEAGCSCTGETDNTSTDCPCGILPEIPCSSAAYPIYPSDRPVNHSTCVMTIKLVYTPLNGTSTQRPCQLLKDGSTQALCHYFNFESSNNEHDFRPFDCTSSDISTNNFVTLYCDTKNLVWRLDVINTAVKYFSQYNVVTKVGC